jgi:quinol monooxygenase YgiN
MKRLHDCELRITKLQTTARALWKNGGKDFREVVARGEINSIDRSQGESMVVLIVHFTAKPGTGEKVKEFMRLMEEHSRREPGCRFYIGHQSVEDAQRFCFYEQYDDPAALEAHRAAPYFAEHVVNGLAHLMESRTQELFTLVG